MDISQCVADAEIIDELSTYQIASFFRRHVSLSKDDCIRSAAGILGSPVSPV
jgi:hypothetical protein